MSGARLFQAVEITQYSGSVVPLAMFNIISVSGFASFLIASICVLAIGMGTLQLGREEKLLFISPN